MRWSTLLPVLAFGGLLLGAKRDLPASELERKYLSAESRFLEFDGWRVHYRDEGSREAPVLVLIHGTGASLHTYDEMVPLLTERFRIIRYDLPGFGLTGSGPDCDFSPAFDASFLQRVLDQLEVTGKVSVVGNSLGGRIAWEYALYQPERVECLVLLDSLGYPLSKWPLAIQGARLPLIGEIQRYVTPRSLVVRSLREVYGQPDRVKDEVIERCFEMLLREDNRASFVRRARVDRTRQSESIASVSQPTLVLWGQLDRWIPVAHAHLFAADIQQAECKIYPHLGHVPQEEEPATVAADILDFLKRSSVSR